jgi:hypothetical protein
MGVIPEVVAGEGGTSYGTLHSDWCSLGLGTEAKSTSLCLFRQLSPLLHKMYFTPGLPTLLRKNMNSAGHGTYKFGALFRFILQHCQYLHYYVAWNGQMNNNFERILKEAVVAYRKLRETEENKFIGGFGVRRVGPRTGSDFLI